MRARGAGLGWRVNGFRGGFRGSESQFRWVINGSRWVLMGFEMGSGVLFSYIWAVFGLEKNVFRENVGMDGWFGAAGAGF
jgi:hypothetical protein